MAFKSVISSQTINDEIINHDFQYVIAGNASWNITLSQLPAPDAAVEDIVMDNNLENFRGNIVPDALQQESQIINESAAIADVSDLQTDIFTARISSFSSSDSASQAAAYEPAASQPPAGTTARNAGQWINSCISSVPAALTPAGDVNISVNGGTGEPDGYKVSMAGATAAAGLISGFAGYALSGGSALSNAAVAGLLSAGIATYRIDNITLRAIDAEKTGVDDTQLCWAGTISNMLYWAGWGRNTGSLSVSKEDDLLDYYRQYFTDAGGYLYRGLEWFLTGDYSGASPAAAQLEKTGGGGFYKNITISNYVHSDYGLTTVMTSLDNFLKDGNICGLGISWGAYYGGHAITCWGISYNTSLSQSDKNYYTGVWISDSDDNYGEGRNAPDIIRFCPVEWYDDIGYLLTYQPGQYGRLEQVVGLSRTFTQNVYDAVSGEIVFDGTQTVFKGGTATSATINNGGIQVVSSGGRVNNAMINSGGAQSVNAGGAVTGATVSSGGQMTINSGASITGLNKLAGAVISATTGATIFNGVNTRNDKHSAFSIINGTASNFLLANADYLLVASGNSAVYTLISSGGRLDVSGTANSTTINSGGRQTVLTGGRAGGTMINSGGSQFVSSGGTALNTVINSEGLQTILAGGAESGAVINNLGKQNVSGRAGGTTINYGGSQTVLNGGVTTAASIKSSGSQFISSGGTANAATISSSGIQIVSSGGTANSTTINYGGMQTVLTGGSGINTIINAEGSQVVYSGGAADSTFVNGYQAILSGGEANVTAIGSGGEQSVFGGTADLTTISSGGMMIISDKATATNIDQQAGGRIGAYTDVTITNGINTRADGGSAFSISNGTASNFLLENYGFLYVSGGHSAVNTVIGSAGDLIVCSGGNAAVVQQLSGGVINTNTDATITDGINTRSDGGSAFSISNGVASNFLLENYGMMSVNSNGLSVNTLINSGGRQLVSSGGAASGTIINSGGREDVYGIDSQTTVTGGGMLMIGSGGSATGFNVSSGGTFGWDFNAVFSGTSNGSGVSSSSNKRSYNLYVDFSQNQKVLSGYTADNSVIMRMGYQTVSAGGVANSTTINTYGGQYVSAGGTANFTTIYGVQTLDRGIAANTTINSGGNQQVGTLAGQASVASNTTVNSGGSQHVYSGSRDTGILTLAGGHVTLDDASAFTSLKTMRYILENAAANDVLLTVDNGNLGAGGTAYYLDFDDAASGSYILADGVNLAGMSNKTFTVNYNDQNISLQAGSSYTFANGGKLSLKFTDSARDQLTAVFSAGSPYIPAISITALTIAAGEPGDTGTYRIYRTGSTRKALTVYFSADGTAAQGSDYVLRSGSTALTDSVVIASGQSYVDVTLEVIDDQAVEVPESAVLSLDTAKTYRTGANSSAAIKIIDDDDHVSPGVASGFKYISSRNSVVLDWENASDDQGGSGVKGYLVEYADNNQFTGAVQRSVTASVLALSGLTEGAYYWRVKTIDNNNNYSDWITGGTFAVDNNAPSVPAGLTYAAAFPNNIVFDWDDAADSCSGVKGYELQIDSSSDFSNPEYDRTGTQSQMTVANLAAGDYYWRVRAQDNSGNWSDWSQYSTLSKAKLETTPPAVPAGLTQQLAGNNVTFDWQDSTDNSGILQYELRVDNNNDFSSPEHAATIAASQDNCSGLATGVYYWQVRAQDNAGNWSAWSKSSSFNITPVDSAANDYKTAQDISSLDNWVGFGDAADVYRITMTNAGILTLGLTGLTGNADLALLNSAGTVLKTSAKTGTADEAISAVSLLAGTYYVKVAAGTNVNAASYILNNTVQYYPVDAAANDYKTAQDISSLDNWVGFGDAADVYKITMTNAGILTLGLTGLTGNADLALLNSAGTVLKTSAKTGTADEAISGVSLLAGTYYVKVAAAYGVNTAVYTLTNTIKYCPVDAAANDYKTAQDISSLDNWVGFGDAADVYKITMTNAGTLTLGLTGLTGNADLSLLSSTGTVLKTSAKAGTADEAISGVSLLAGTYYVKVAAAYGVNTAAYTLANTINYFAGDTYDKAGNTIAAAKVVDSPTQTGWVGFGDSADYYRFDFATAAQGTLRLYDITGGNADLTLYNAKGIQLKRSANTGTLEDTITSTLAAGTYYARVTAVSGNIDYKLDFNKKDIVSGMLAS